MKNKIKPIFKNVYEEMHEKKGTTNILINEADKANQARAEEVELKNIIRKYGITPFEYLNTTKEPLYLDMRGTEIPIGERMQQKYRIDKYFEEMPAIIRDKYNNNKEEFYNELIYGNHNSFIENGILTKEHSQEFINKRNEKTKQINELTNTINSLQTQLNSMKEVTNELQKD